LLLGISLIPPLRGFPIFFLARRFRPRFYMTRRENSLGRVHSGSIPTHRKIWLVTIASCRERIFKSWMVLLRWHSIRHVVDWRGVVRSLLGLGRGLLFVFWIRLIWPL
jgi:hypothetical protein